MIQSTAVGFQDFYGPTVAEGLPVRSVGSESVEGV